MRVCVSVCLHVCVCVFLKESDLALFVGKRVKLIQFLTFLIESSPPPLQTVRYCNGKQVENSTTQGSVEDSI